MTLQFGRRFAAGIDLAFVAALFIFERTRLNRHPTHLKPSFSLLKLCLKFHLKHSLLASKAFSNSGWQVERLYNIAFLLTSVASCCSNHQFNGRSRDTFDLLFQIVDTFLDGFDETSSEQGMVYRIARGFRKVLSMIIVSIDTRKAWHPTYLLPADVNASLACC